MLAVIVALALSSTPTQAVRRDRRLDVEVAAFTAMPERFAVCLGAHPGSLLEVDLCVQPDVHVLTGSAHAFVRGRWVPTCFDAAGWKCLELALGPGLGARVSRFCGPSTCAAGGGPEAFASLEAVQWVSTALGVSLQLDAGLAVVWSEVVAGVVRPSVRFPVRLLAGVTF